MPSARTLEREKPRKTKSVKSTQDQKRKGYKSPLARYERAMDSFRPSLKNRPRSQLSKESKSLRKSSSTVIQNSNRKSSVKIFQGLKSHEKEKSPDVSYVVQSSTTPTVVD